MLAVVVSFCCRCRGVNLGSTLATSGQFKLRSQGPSLGPSRQTFLLMSHDHEEFIRQLTAAQRRLYAYIYSLVPSADAANEILQETNLAMWRKAEEAEEIRSFEAWSFTVARYAVMTWLKNQSREKLKFDHSLVSLLADQAAESMANLDHRQRALSRCLKQLAESSRELIRRRYVRGESVQIIASTLDRSCAAISQALYRIRNSLQECIELQLAREEEA